MCSICSCDLQGGAQLLETIALSTDQVTEAYDQIGKATYAEQSDVDGMAFALSSSDIIATKREETGAAIASLKLRVLALGKYKTNYELLCGQVSELNAQIGLQLQRHESDVTAFQVLIADLQSKKMALEVQVVNMQQTLALEQDIAEQDRAYLEKVNWQLSTAPELLKATEKRLEQQEVHFTADIKKLRAQLATGDEKHAEDQVRILALKQELKLCLARETVDKEQEVSRRTRETRKHKLEMKKRATKLQALDEELKVQRSTVRATKKQLIKAQANNDALCKQLANVKRDGAHLSNVIDSQRVEHEAQIYNIIDSEKRKSQLAKRVAVLCQENQQLRKYLADAKDDIVSKDNEVENYENELMSLRIELRQTLQRLEEMQCSNNNFVKQIKRLQNAACERHVEVKRKMKIQRQSLDSKHRKEVVCLRELFTDNQQRATESFRGVQRLRREHLTV